MPYCQSKRHGCIRFPWKRRLLTFVALSFFLPRIGFGGLLVNFINENPNYVPANIYVAFGGLANDALFSANIKGGANLKLGTSYSLVDLKPGTLLTKFIGGRLCISLGKPFRSMSPTNANNPNFNNPSLPDFNLRWDKAEMTYDVNNPFSTMNLSATDFFSVRLRVQTYHAGKLVSTLTWQKPIAKAFHDTGVLSGFSRDAVCTDNQTGVPTEGLTPGSIVNVVRVIAPSTIRADVVNPYPSFQPYIDHVQGGGIKTKIEGKFLGDPPSTYQFTAVVDSAGALVMTGTVTTNSTPQSHVIIISSSNLDRGIYTADPECNIDGVNKHPLNTVFGAAVRDALSGFSYGFIGSKEQNPNAPGLTFGDSASYQWYTPPLPITYAFAGAQPNHPFYNQYAAVLVPLTDAYGFPYSDLVQKPLADLNPKEIDSIDITVLAD